MYSRRNLERFFEHHPEHAGMRPDVDAKLKELVPDDVRIFSGELIDVAFPPPVAREFHNDVQTDPVHIQMGIADIAATFRVPQREVLESRSISPDDDLSTADALGLSRLIG